MSEVEYANFSEDRIEDLIDILYRSKRSDPHERRLTPEEMRGFYFEDPDFRADGTWIALESGNPVGLGWTIVEANRLRAGKDDAYFEVEVVPEHRGKGIEEELTSKCLDYIRSKGIGKARSRRFEGDEWKRRLLEGYSFSESYRIYDLVRRSGADVPAVELPPGYVLDRTPLSALSDDEIRRLVETFNESFFDHYNFAPERPERFISIRDNWKDPWTAISARKGEEIAGVCLVEKSDTYNAEKGTNLGWVIILGVRQEHRRQGLARAMLADAIACLLGEGIETVLIGVQAMNEKALDLYESFGFVKEHESVSLMREL